MTIFCTISIRSQTSHVTGTITILVDILWKSRIDVVFCDWGECRWRFTYSEKSASWECSLSSFILGPFFCLQPSPIHHLHITYPERSLFSPTFEPPHRPPTRPAQNNNRYPSRSNRPSSRSSSLPRSVFPWWFDDTTIRWTDG